MLLYTILSKPAATFGRLSKYLLGTQAAYVVHQVIGYVIGQSCCQFDQKITGGEPFMSGHTWKLIDWFKTNQGRSQTRLAINSNLGAEIDIDRLINSVQGMAVEIYTSQEATGSAAEYIRDGLDYAAWQANVIRLLDAGITVHCMCTINALCLETLPDHLNYLVDLKKKYSKEKINFTLNILRFPSFQSALVLPDNLRTQFREQLVKFLVQHKGYSYLHEHEINHAQRLIDYLDVVKTPHSEAFELPKLLNDFREFYTQYDQRRNKNFLLAFPALTQWYNLL
jgi:hypothetical protein